MRNLIHYLSLTRDLSDFTYTYYHFLSNVDQIFNMLTFSWQYRSPKLQQYRNYRSYIDYQELRQSFDHEAASGGKKYLLSAAVGAGRVVMEVYYVPKLAE